MLICYLIIQSDIINIDFYFILFYFILINVEMNTNN